MLSGTSVHATCARSDKSCAYISRPLFPNRPLLWYESTPTLCTCPGDTSISRTPDVRRHRGPKAVHFCPKLREHSANGCSKTSSVAGTHFPRLSLTTARLGSLRVRTSPTNTSFITFAFRAITRKRTVLSSDRTSTFVTLYSRRPKVMVHAGILVSIPSSGRTAFLFAAASDVRLTSQSPAATRSFRSISRKQHT